MLKMRGNTDVQSALPLFMSLVNPLLAAPFSFIDFIVTVSKRKTVAYYPCLVLQ